MDEKLKQNIVHLAILLVLLLALVATLIFTGILGCNIVPGGCELYYTVLKGGAPQILIVHGDEGLGDYTKLEALFNEPDLLRARAKSMDIEKISYGNIIEYDLIIVEQARKICSDKLKIFMFYVNSGGRLVWTADAGTELCSGEVSGNTSQTDEFLLESQRTEGKEAKIIGPWARKEGDDQLSFDEFLGVNYKGNYCEFTECVQGLEVGRIEPISPSHKLTYGLSPSIPFEGDFSVVEFNNAPNSRLVAVLDYGTNLLGESYGQPWLESGKKYNFGKSIPFIVSSSVGERVAYYATPLENFVDNKHNYKALIEQMYYGMLYN